MDINVNQTINRTQVVLYAAAGESAALEAECCLRLCCKQTSAKLLFRIEKELKNQGKTKKGDEHSAQRYRQRC